MIQLENKMIEEKKKGILSETGLVFSKAEKGCEAGELVNWRERERRGRETERGRSEWKHAEN